MLTPLLIFAQLAVAPDSVYATAAVRALVTRAAIENHAPPVAFRGYRARVESEMSLLLRDTLGRERAAQLEQVASSINWVRGGDYEMHVVGFRAQSLGSPISTLTYIRGWTEPSLYGERLRLGAQVGPDSSSPRRDTIVVVHPFATDRDDYYRFAGGDTVTVLHIGARSVAIVRLQVTPHLRDSARFGAFDGEIDLDAERGQIVRMRGQFVVLGPPRSGPRAFVSRVPGLVAVAYAEFVNTEVNGRYWLPAFQRSEFQTTFALLGRQRAVMRILSRFSDYSIDDTSASNIASTDVNRIPHRTTWASSDSVSRFGDWHAPIGEITSSVTANDFDDVGPDVWKATGSPRIDFMPATADHLVRFDRIQGLYTGLESTLHMRSAVPGLSVGAMGGYAWTERTARGGIHASLHRDAWTVGARAERSLPSTNDFLRPFEPQSGGVAAALGSLDDFDYVDRRVALASVTRVVGSIEQALVTVQLGFGDDRAERARLTRGWIGSGAFRANRGVMPGTYSLASVDAEYHPSLSGDFVQPGVGARIHYEAATGTLSWQRTELTLSGREYFGPVALSAEAQGGVVSGAVIPPQTLFELGGNAGLPGYDYKEFAGDRAALFRGYANYTSSFLRVPKRVWRNVYIPGLAPGFAVGIQGGWTELSNDAALRSLAGLGDPSRSSVVSRATDGVRATAGFGLTLFSGIMHIGVARPVDRPAPWKFVVGFGPTF
ncbi:MAG: hypothetical protein ABI969_02115 [bacterium]